MMKRSMIVTALFVAAILGEAGTVLAKTAYVGAIGGGGWYSGDTRTGTGANVVGLNYTHAAVSNPPGPAASEADDTTIASRFTFVAGPAGTSTGALHIAHPDAPSIKSSIDVIDAVDGLATGAWQTGFSADWRRYATGGALRSVSLAIGVQSTLWADSQAGFEATRSGETVWDLQLVNNQTNIYDAWTTYHVDSGVSGTNGNTFKLSRQVGNNFFEVPGTGTLTLDGWASCSTLAIDLDDDKVKDAGDYTWGDVLFGASAKVTQFGFLAGSGQYEANQYIDWVETSLLNGGDRIEFVPEPSTLALLVTAGLGMLAYAVRRRRS